MPKQVALFQCCNGSIDLVIKTEDFIYIIDLKYDGSPEAAIRQINTKEYPLRYQNDPRQLFKIGANFSSKTRRISSWLIQR